MEADVDIVVCPPFVYLADIKSWLQGSAISWGAQNLSQHKDGAYTGEVASSMLSDFGCRYVIVGHSERRLLYGETNNIIAEKFAAAQQENLIPIVCIGETLEERKQGVTEQVLKHQLDAVVQRTGIDTWAKAVIAYEPVWAIGTGHTATPDQAQDVHALIRAYFTTQNPSIAKRLLILYGGSVKGNNAAQLLAMPDIDGGLIGGASLNAEEFLIICRAAVN
ncbi:triosephosphate isomerase [Candidatus Nitrosoglobus terrae]|uniref:Triosephosphate isomerase n=2 Tax=Candidatus Nitrosoglobus terrae TaxID=1630141 RepID=A0A1Q2SKU6_9GAMM|nr:triosephosphate isomerase [Candidatus Nitrosoglobus terrae]